MLVGLAHPAPAALLILVLLSHLLPSPLWACVSRGRAPCQSSSASPTARTVQRRATSYTSSFLPYDINSLYLSEVGNQVLVVNQSPLTTGQLVKVNHLLCSLNGRHLAKLQREGAVLRFYLYKPFHLTAHFI